MTAPSVLEKVRMCVAEAGYDPERHVRLTGTMVEIHRDVPDVVAWRARELVALKRAVCLQCFTSEEFPRQIKNVIDACLADRRLVLDCGRTR